MKALAFFVALLLLFAGAYLIKYASQEGSSGVSVAETDEEYTPPVDPITEFEFTDQLQQTFNSKALDGQVWMGSFFFADCPSICADQNAEIAKLFTRFADTEVSILSITTAPKDDHPSKLWKYANRFEADHTRWKFLTGKPIEYVRRVGVDFFQLAAADETHTSHVAVFDRQGTRRGAYNVLMPEEYAKLVNLVNELLAEPEVNHSVPDGDTEDVSEVTDTSASQVEANS